jgi:uncharacterized protein
MMNSQRAADFPAQEPCRSPKVGIGYRRYLHNWTMEHLDRFDIAEITIDHYLWSNERQRELIEEISRHLPIIGHSVGLSIGTDTPLDHAYLDRVADTLERIGARSYSEHVAFTKAPPPPKNAAEQTNTPLPGNDTAWLDLANLIPIPKTAETIEILAAKIEEVQRRISVPFLLENITYYFEYPDSTMDDATFFNTICGATGAKILLDVENLYINSVNHRFDARHVIDAFDKNLVEQVHMAGGIDYQADESTSDVLLIDSHDQPLREKTSELLDYLLTRQSPDSIILERDGRLDKRHWPELLSDLSTIRKVVSANSGRGREG